ncbi:MAG TPA: ADP-ribosylation factor-like protein, partial [Thiolinea sp.]|nr:ADP-ribosylation factor-like protein [Thiolinea sp.]
ISVGETDLSLMVWDIAGEDDFTNIRSAHLRGLSGYIVVIDGTRQNSFNVALALHERIKNELGEVAAVFALNKCDLRDQWVINHEHIRTLAKLGYPIIETSAKLDQGVEEMFMGLARQLVAEKSEA